MKLYARIIMMIFVVICTVFCLAMCIVKYILLLNPDKLNFELKILKTRCSINFNKE